MTEQQARRKAIQVLRDMAKLFERKELAKGTYARDKNGNKVWEHETRRAAAFCIYGAELVIARRMKIPCFWENAGDIVERSLEKVTRATSLAEWNDNPRRTKQQVINAINKAITLLEKEEANATATN